MELSSKEPRSLRDSIYKKYFFIISHWLFLDHHSEIPGYFSEPLIIWGFPDSSVGKESTYNAGDPSSFPGLGRQATFCTWDA